MSFQTGAFRIQDVFEEAGRHFAPQIIRRRESFSTGKGGLRFALFRAFLRLPSSASEGTDAVSEACGSGDCHGVSVVIDHCGHRRGPEGVQCTTAYQANTVDSNKNNLDSVEACLLASEAKGQIHPSLPPPVKVEQQQKHP